MRAFLILSIHYPSSPAPTLSLAISHTKLHVPARPPFVHLLQSFPSSVEAKYARICFSS
jgi:hypothetical protein